MAEKSILCVQGLDGQLKVACEHKTAFPIYEGGEFASCGERDDNIRFTGDYFCPKCRQVVRFDIHQSESEDT